MMSQKEADYKLRESYTVSRWILIFLAVVTLINWAVPESVISGGVYAPIFRVLSALGMRVYILAIPTLVCGFAAKYSFKWMISAVVIYALDVLMHAVLTAILIVTTVTTAVKGYSMGSLAAWAIVAAVVVGELVPIAIRAAFMMNFVSAIKKGRQLAALPDMPAPKADDLIEDSVPLRKAEENAKAKILISGEFDGYNVVYRRVNPVNQLVVNGEIYAEKAYTLSTAPHSMRVRVGGRVFSAGYDGKSCYYIWSDGEAAAKKRRFL